MSAPFALTVRGPSDLIFDLSDRLGFDAPMEALAVSLFEDGPERMCVQALYESGQDADRTLKSLQLPHTVESFIAQLPDEDWVSKSQQGLPPVEAGRFWVHGTHDADSVPPECEFPIRIDAGLAFGTGHHGTTKGCLIVFDDLILSGWRPATVLDLGCGAGILAIAAAMVLQQPVTASDIDPDAVDVTQKNAAINHVADYIDAFQADGFESANLRGRTFDLIFANILAGPLMGLAPEIAVSLKSGGRAILSGIMDEQAEKVGEAFAAQGLKVSAQPSLSGWTTLLAEKFSA